MWSGEGEGEGTTGSWWVRKGRVRGAAGSEGTENSRVEEEGGALNGKPFQDLGRGAGRAGRHKWGLGGQVLTMGSAQDVPGRRGRPGSGLDIIASATPPPPPWKGFVLPGCPGDVPRSQVSRRSMVQPNRPDSCV